MSQSPELCPLEPGLSVTGRLDAAGIEALARAGVRMVINNRPDGEEPGQSDGAEIADAAMKAGLLYRHIAVAGGFPEAHIHDMADAVADPGGPVLAFCRTGTRSTLLWALAQASKGGNPDDIAAAAAAAGYDIAPVRGGVERLAGSTS